MPAGGHGAHEGLLGAPGEGLEDGLRGGGGGGAEAGAVPGATGVDGTDEGGGDEVGVWGLFFIG